MTSSGVATDVGRVREHNEDSYLVRPPVFAVADGMGGHAAGEVASRMATEALESAGLGADSGPDAIRRALRQANRVIHEQASADGPAHGMGTTCALLIVAEGVAHVGHVGDSRIYLLRGESLKQLTRDHTVVADMVEKGLMTDEQALTDRTRGYLTRALGGAADVDADVRSVDTQDGDRFLLCSDGLTTMVADEDMRQILVDETDPQVAADQLVSAANRAGGEDNITALVVDPVETGVPQRTRGPRRASRWAQAAIVLLALVAGILALLFFNGPLGVPPMSPPTSPPSASPPAIQQPTPSPGAPSPTALPQSTNAPVSPDGSATPP